MPQVSTPAPASNPQPPIPPARTAALQVARSDHTRSRRPPPTTAGLSVLRPYRPTGLPPWPPTARLPPPTTTVAASPTRSTPASPPPGLERPPPDGLPSGPRVNFAGHPDSHVQSPAARRQPAYERAYTARRHALTLSPHSASSAARKSKHPRLQSSQDADPPGILHRSRPRRTPSSLTNTRSPITYSRDTNPLPATPPPSPPPTPPRHRTPPSRATPAPLLRLSPRTPIRRRLRQLDTPSAPAASDPPHLGNSPARQGSISASTGPPPFARPTPRCAIRSLQHPPGADPRRHHPNRRRSPI